MTEITRQTLATNAYNRMVELFDENSTITTDEITRAIYLDVVSDQFPIYFPVLIEWAKEVKAPIWMGEVTETIVAEDFALVTTRKVRPIVDLIRDDGIEMGYYGDDEGFLGHLLSGYLSEDQHDQLMTLFDERDVATGKLPADSDHAHIDAVVGPLFQRLDEELGTPSPDWEDRLLDRIEADTHDRTVNALLGVSNETEEQEER